MRPHETQNLGKARRHLVTAQFSLGAAERQACAGEHREGICHLGKGEGTQLCFVQ